MKKSSSSKADKLKQSKDHRLDDRQPVLRAADLVLSEKQAPVACLVKDVSNTGLKLIYDSPHELPERVTIMLHHPNDVLVCEVMWQKEKEIGLRIVDVE